MVIARDYLLIETEKLLITGLSKAPLVSKVKHTTNPVELLYCSVVVLSILMVCIFGVHTVGWPPYVGIGIFIMLCGVSSALYGKRIIKMLSERMVFAAHIMSCILFPRSSGVSFVEIVVADILTSLSQILADASLAIVLVFCMWTGWSPPGECYRGLVMTFAACFPLVLHIRQCIILMKNSSKQHSKIHLLNILKYLSSIPVAWLSFTSRDPYQPTFMTKTQRRYLDFLCITFNTLYCFFWDVMIDRGIMQRGAMGLRHERLLMPYRWIYYLAMLLNAAGRCTWSIRWISLFSSSLTITRVDSILVLELAEVTRRALWSVFRIEWEHVRPKMKLLDQYHHDSEANFSKIDLLGDGM